VRVAVVGHVEWVDFARVPRLPDAGEIVSATEWWQAPGGGGAVAAVQLAKLAGRATFFTAVGDDDLGRRARAELEALGVEVHAAVRAVPQRRALTHVDRSGERTITVLGERLVPAGGDPLPWAALEEVDGVYFTGGDAAALRHARKARVLVATPRARNPLEHAGVHVDALVHSAGDPDESRSAETIRPAPRLVVATAGLEGGRYGGAEGETGTWEAAPLPGPISDTYGAGDSFAAGLTFALAAGRSVAESVALAARCGAASLTGRGPYEGQLTLAGTTSPGTP
jgi:ribokinase